MNIETLKEVLLKCWGKDTCYPPMQDDWSLENPAYGQCYSTALVVNDFFGGKILKAEFEDGSGHFWNLIGDEEVDLTRSQFEEGEIIPKPEVYTREEIVNKPGYERYNLRYRILKKRVNDLLG